MIKWKYECPDCDIEITGEDRATQANYDKAVSRHKKTHNK